MNLDDEELKATRRMNGSDKNVACMEEDIKLVENLIKEYKLYGDLDGIAINDMSAYINALEHLIKTYKELEEENKNLKTRYDKYGRVLFTPEAIAEKHIPKSKIKEKIEKTRDINNKNTVYIGGKGAGKTFQQAVNERVIDVLQELLEGK